jgi:flagellar hook-basal body complex protein FliE
MAGIPPISQLTSKAASGIGESTSAAEATPGSPGFAAADFGNALKDAASALNNMSSQADASSVALATGAPVDVHEAMLNVQNASLGFQFAVQVRNKIVDAYDEVMRMSI